MSLVRIPLGALGVDAPRRGFPLVPARLRLGDQPALGLFHPVALPAARAGVARAGSPALVVRDGVLEVGFPGMPGAGREGAFPVADLDQVTQGVVRLVRVRLVAVVAGERWNGFQRHGELPAAGQMGTTEAVSEAPTVDQLGLF